jgi:molybdopterin/thiamine biosynthesis adenylyltransferase
VNVSASFLRWEADNLEDLVEVIIESSIAKQHPDGTAYDSISLQDTAKLADQFQLPQKEIELIALKNKVLPERYTRNMNSLSASDQVRLLQSRVGIVGLGGLGGTVAETLARIGVGTITLIDGDVFEESNLNRQLISSEKNLSLLKVEAATQRIMDINSSITVYSHPKKLDPENAVELLTDVDVAIDCLDSITTRFDLETASKALGIPLVSAAVGGYAGQLTTIFPEDRGLELIYGPIESISVTRGAEVKLGNLSFTVSTLASLESAEVVNILINKTSSLRNRLLIIDLQNYSFERIRLI